MHAARGEDVPPHIHFCPGCNEDRACFLGCEDTIREATCGDFAVGRSDYCSEECRRNEEARQEQQARRREAIRRLSPAVAPTEFQQLARPVTVQPRQGFTVTATVNMPKGSVFKL